MRKLNAGLFMSLDGVVEAPQSWAFTYQSDDMTVFNQAGMRQSDALLLGRATHTEFASYWPHQQGDPAGMVRHLNTVFKYVVSRSLNTPDWSNTTVPSGPLTDDVQRLKQQPGQDIAVIGSTLVAGLTQAGLVDEYLFWIFPLTLRHGKRLFEDSARVPMTLVRTQGYLWRGAADLLPRTGALTC